MYSVKSILHPRFDELVNASASCIIRKLNPYSMNTAGREG